MLGHTSIVPHVNHWLYLSFDYERRTRDSSVALKLSTRVRIEPVVTNANPRALASEPPTRPSSEAFSVRQDLA